MGRGNWRTNANVPQLSVESSYYTWVDQHNTLGLGANVPIATGNLFWLEGARHLGDERGSQAMA